MISKEYFLKCKKNIIILLNNYYNSLYTKSLIKNKLIIRIIVKNNLFMISNYEFFSFVKLT